MYEQINWQVAGDQDDCWKMFSFARHRGERI